MMFSTKLYCFNELKNYYLKHQIFSLINCWSPIIGRHRESIAVFIELVKVVEIKIVLYAFPDVVGGVGFFLQERF